MGHLFNVYIINMPVMMRGFHVALLKHVSGLESAAYCGSVLRSADGVVSVIGTFISMRGLRGVGSFETHRAMFAFLLTCLMYAGCPVCHLPRHNQLYSHNGYRRQPAIPVHIILVSAAVLGCQIVWPFYGITLH